MKNIDKTIIAEVAKMLSTINLKNKHSKAISNANMDAARDLELICIKKYWKHIGQI